ncbi:MoaD/ThiS family protein [Prochlorococcus sp. AH-716-F10]|jgi:molybdopterin synthase sulfur carrier subunit|nr:MoaD/ThiS family protein [Prochlorococcus sp. AH-716-F10]|tara:strand:- start:444 stop:698 length:255 start_codon:yes stop_codon:yes gene_type:complete
MGIESCNKIKVILFASLEEDMGWKEKILRIDNNVEMKVNSIWDLINCDLPKENFIVAVNDEIVDMDSSINTGDEVAFMPIFTGG